MSELNLEISRRAHQGSGVVNAQYRKKNRIPGVLYGKKKENVSIECCQFALDKLIKHPEFHSQIIYVSLEGKKEPVLVKDIQWHHSGTRVLHLDLMRVDPKSALTATLHFKWEGVEKNKAINTENAQLNELMHSVDVRCLPKDLPAHLSVDISGLVMDATLHLSDVVLPKGVEWVQVVDEVHNPAIVSLHKIKTIQEEPVVPEASAETAEESTTEVTDEEASKE